MALLGFDIEIANVFELAPGEDLEAHGPFDISVAASAVAGGEERLWLTKGPDDRPARHLDRDTARAMLAYLEDAQRAGHRLVAWNGLSFDLRWIGHAADDLAAARRVALGLYDPMYQFFKLKGFPVGLAKVAEGLGLPMRKSMSGADAPQRWAAGEHEAVCEYVLGDVRITLAIAQAIEDRHEVPWMTQRGSVSRVALPALRPVSECLTDAIPDQSWMKTPMTDAHFRAWLEA